MISKLLIITTLVAVLFTAMGCSKRESTPATTKIASTESINTTGSNAIAVTRRTVVYGLDITGSYAFLQAGFDQAAQTLMNEAQPNDTWYFRYITNKSYSDRAAILTVQF